ncbi:transmembrane receptor [Cryptococcus neoformans C23]|uniref:Transmembrane receptor n=1 Tax=Cryptococcus neoformans (strain H99 / ATCC 208821 / CBS 10515 / FGSC 9487) TaxID=235443 RepID=J9VVV3_CRYN9|nr:transmembrane receptor [Cryptococcus neoformans var. grubii H99]AFR96749.2 transmembrane receptor [Cryptococcus neoformans var. grubii H99]AUB26704.1 transmembrane receptor [Cryptococcus neoformans var. grubii]OWZ41715.1 transmembrane receptor [Cryptococcus neoformans var. grubii C23]|eukprot:XP_012050987.1 transmembrane receptor [Cryptococcus neoformans var. grubii H99]
MLTHLFYVVVVLMSSLVSRAQDDAWHLDYVYTLANEELDPIISPNQQSSHMHKIIGGSRMAAYYNFDDYSAADCSSLRIQADKSNYWMPQLYFVDNSTSKYVPISAKIRFYYFLGRSSTAEPVISFPKGLRMLVGDPFNKAPTNLASFTCQIKDGFADSLIADNFNFDRDCPYGLKTELFFPPCWDGYNLYKSDGSHMAYPSQNVRDGMCPWTHPIRLPAIQLEYTWRTSYYNPGTVLNGHLAWANGDTTGYGIHGDFVNGWDLDVLNAALKDPSCVGINMSIPMDDCPTLYAQFDDAAASICVPERGILTETFGNIDLVPIDRLPGCNPLWSNGDKPTCDPPIAGLDVSGFKGTDGPYIAAVEDQKNFIWPTEPGWTNIACLHDVSSLSGGTSYADQSMTVESCTSSCLKSGYNFAGTGQVGIYWTCVCGTSINSNAYVEPGMCTTSCPGNSSEACGGTYRFNIWYAPNGTTSNSGTLRDDGSEYLGCYDDPAAASDGLLGQATYSFQSLSMTTEVCIEACAQAGRRWAATLSARSCYCGDEFYYGTGTFMPDSYCTVACTGNSSEICGDYYKSSVYNITGVQQIANASDSHLAGYQGCYQDKSGHLALTNNSWASESLTPLTCINGCSELGYSYAGVEGGNTCYCGSQVSSTVTVLPASQCQAACAGNSSDTCGGTQAMDLYTMAAATDTPITIRASHPAGYLGCYKDAGSNMAFNNYYTYHITSMTVETCKAACVELGYLYAGLTDGFECRCGDNYPQTTQMVSDLYCTKPCYGNASETCGAGGFLEGYDLSDMTAAPVMSGASEGSYIGCYDNSNRGLISYSYVDGAMTVEACRTTCSEFGYGLAGVYFASYCSCGDAWTGATEKYPSNACQYYACKGNSSEWCGGTTQLAIYNASDVVVTYDKPSGWLSCWSDSSTSRSLTGYFYSANPMSAHACRTACNQQGYTYAATESGNQCLCGNTLGGEKAPTSNCKTACSGNANETCGGSNYMDLYNATGAAADNGIAGYVGCFTDDSSLSTASYVSDYMDVDICIRWCYARGAAYAGVRVSSGSKMQCKCGPSSPSLVTTLSACATPCTADSSQPCGSTTAIGVYQLSQTSITSGEFTISSNSSGYAGCYHEGGTRMLPSYSFSLSTMSNPLCISNCKTLGYALAGTEYAQQCWCANALDATSGGYKVQESDCSTTCSGGAGICGAANTLSVWSTVNASSDSVAVEGYKGCYSVGDFLSSTPLTYSGGYMTTDLCRRTCRSAGYAIAGLTNANTCACGNNPNYGAQAAPATCNAPCSGNTTQTCGATYSKALTIFDTTGAAAQVPSGFAANYVGCISDGSPRKLSAYSFKNGGMTIDMAFKICSAANYPAYGTENGNEGYCGASKLSVGLLPDSYCSTACAGLATAQCGGAGRLSYFYLDATVNDTSRTTTASSTSAAANSTSSAFINSTAILSTSTTSNTATATTIITSAIPHTNVTSSSTSTNSGLSATASVSAFNASGSTSMTSLLSGTASSSSNSADINSTVSFTSTASIINATSFMASQTGAYSTSTETMLSASSTETGPSGEILVPSSTSSSPSGSFTATAPATSIPVSSAAYSSSLYSINSSTASASISIVTSVVTMYISTTALSDTLGSSTSTSAAAAQTSSVNLGCYSGSPSSFSNAKMTSHDDLTVSMCQIWCNANYYSYAGLTNGTTCGCSNELDGMTSTSDDTCVAVCSGDASQACGGNGSVYSVYTAVAASQKRRRSEIEQPAARGQTDKGKMIFHGRRMDRRTTTGWAAGLL